MRRVARRAGIGHDQAGAGGEEAEEVVDREVEAERGEGEDAVLGADGEAPVDVEHRVEGAPVIDHHPLGLAGRAGGEDDVGEVLRRRERRERLGLHPRSEERLVDRHRHDAVGPLVAQGDSGLGESDAHLAAGEELADALGRQGGIDRQVGTPRAQHREGGDHLLPPLLHDHCDEPVRLGAEPAQPLRERERGALERAVTDRALRSDHSRRRWPEPSLFEEGLIQQPGRQGGGGVVYFGKQPPLRRRQPHRRSRAPNVRVLRTSSQPPDQLPIRRKHVVEQPLWKQLLDRIPVVHQPAADLGDLMVEPDLRRLGDTEDQLARRAGLVAACRLARRRLGLVERAGEDHRHERGAPALRTIELAQHLDAADQAMLEVLPEAHLQPLRPLRERLAGHALGGEQGQRGEVAYDLVDLRVEGEPVEQRQVERQAAARAPARQHLGEGGEQHARGGERGAGRPRLERRPGCAVELPAAAGEARAGDLGRIPGERQPRGGRQAGEPAAPVLQGAGVGGRLAQRGHVQHIIAKGEVERRQLRPGVRVEAGEVAGEDAEAPGVADQQVEADVQAGAAAGQEGRGDLEQRPAVARQNLVRQAPAHREQARLQAGGGEPAEVDHADPVRRHRGQDALPAVGEDDRAQHAVAVDQPPQRPLQAAEVERGEVDLQVEVGRHRAELDGAAAADPVGLLDAGEREGEVRRGPVRRDPPQLLHLLRGLRLRPRHRRREAGQGGRREQGGEGELDAERLAQPEHQAGGEDRVTAEREEVVAGPHPLDPQHLRPESRQRLLERALRRDPGGVRGRGGLPGRRQRLAVDLAVGGERQGGQGDEDRRQHGVRQGLAQAGAQRLGRDLGPRGRHHVSNEERIAGRPGPRHHHGLRHRRAAGERDLDLPQLDAEAADLDLVVGAAEEVEAAVGRHPSQVAGAVEAGARYGRERIGREALRGQLGPAEIAAGDAGAADPDLAGDPPGGRLPPAVDDVESGVGDRPAERRDRCGQRGVDAQGGRPDRGLGGPIDVPQLVAARAQEVGEVGRQRLAAAQRAAQARALPARREQHPPGGRRGLEHGRPRGAQPREEERAVAGLLGAGHLDAGAGHERQIELQARDVEGERGDGEQHIRRLDPGRALHGEQEVEQRAVRHLHPLRPARRARGVEHISQTLPVPPVLAVLVVLVVLSLLHPHHPHPVHRPPADHQPRAAVPEHEAQPLRRIPRVERQVGAAGLPDREAGDEQLW